MSSGLRNRKLRRPPNIHEIESVVLLRQALDILAAPEEVQRSLYPEGRDPASEMALLFEDAWGRVQPVFWPILARDLRRALETIEVALESSPSDWAAIRPAAAEASSCLPGPREPGPPRAWLDQLVHARHQLLLRRQLDS